MNVDRAGLTLRRELSRLRTGCELALNLLCAYNQLIVKPSRHERTSRVVLYHRSRSRISSVIREKYLYNISVLAHRARECKGSRQSVYLGQVRKKQGRGTGNKEPRARGVCVKKVYALERKACPRLQMCAVLLWVAEAIDNLSRRDRILDCLVNTGT